MNTKKIDILNIGLIAISFLIAIKLPFKLFLFSYAILGPLHYLTEIAWLKKRNYFVTSNKKWTVLLIILSFLLAMYPVYEFIDVGFTEFIHNIITFIGENNNTLLLIGFLFAVGLIFVKKVKHLIMSLAAAFILALLLTMYIPKSLILLGLFLPTLVHVYLFTFLFIIFGALKSKSRYGFYLGIILICIPFIIWQMPLDILNYTPSKATIDTYIASSMMGVNYEIAVFFNQLENDTFFALSESGLRIQIFIGFAYTYHYLNWFSKTSVIGWKKAISKQKGILILCIWILSIALYIYDYKTGLIALFFLSFLHVFLEFPLNVLTIKEVFSLKNYKMK